MDSESSLYMTIEYRIYDIKLKTLTNNTKRARCFHFTTCCYYTRLSFPCIQNDIYLVSPVYLPTSIFVHVLTAVHLSMRVCTFPKLRTASTRQRSPRDWKQGNARAHCKCGICVGRGRGRETARWECRSVPSCQRRLLKRPESCTAGCGTGT